VLSPSLPADRLAQYASFRVDDPNKTITWKDFYNRFGAIPVQLNPSVLNSDEAIVAVLGHEMHELNALRDLFEESPNGRMKATYLWRLVATGIKDNLHDKAWDVANDLVEKMRGRQ